MLTKKETALFESKDVAPQFAIVPIEQKRIVFYQMKTSPCPHLNSQNKCRIYEKRPLICRSFPIMADYISSRCKVFSKRKPGQIYQDVYPMIEMKEASKKISRYVMENFGKELKTGVQEWEYDLASRKWILRK